MDNLATTIMVLIILVPLVLLLGGWLFMLFIGNASIASAGLIPALGYWPSFWVVVAIKTATATSSAIKR
ncbi:MAG: hypothetical protein LC650_00515 [Actinobacteria bacterium]|nr:hypothetical protein [Actinomycetota bacterium]